MKHKPLKHGTLTAYRNYGCRCNECKKARSDYWNELDSFRGAKAKWYTIYKESSPWPLDGAKPAEASQALPPVAAPPVTEPPANQTQVAADDPMAKEKEYLLSELRLQAKINKGDIVIEAQRALGYPVGLEHIAACSLDALRELVWLIR